MTTIAVIIPAFNEEKAIGKVLSDIPSNLVAEVIVVDNNSSDQTSKVAGSLGATVLREKKQGYGFACLKGIEYLHLKENHPDIVVFLDADHSDHPEEMLSLVHPIQEQGCDMVIGARDPRLRQPGAMLPQQIFGNWLATYMLRILYGANFTDLGPFRAIRFDKLLQLQMKDTTYGWTVEMQVKAIKHQLKYREVPVSYRKRTGVSKITGTVKGTIGAGYKIITTILKYAFN